MTFDLFSFGVGAIVGFILSGIIGGMVSAYVFRRWRRNPYAPKAV